MWFGYRGIALSQDGSTLAVGADSAGRAFVFTRSGVTWSQQAIIQSALSFSFFGNSVALSSDGNTLAVANLVENSAATGINGNQADTSASAAGAAFIFVRSGTTWSAQAYIKPSNTDAGDAFGCALALSSDGSNLVVGSFSEDSGSTGVGGVQSDNTVSQSGAAYVFTRSGVVWSQQAYIKASNTGAGDSFGIDVAISGDGDTIAVGAPYESSSAVGVGGDESNNALSSSGAVYVFTRSAGIWSQQAYVKAANMIPANAGSAYFGNSVSLNSTGSRLAVGAPGERSTGTGVGAIETVPGTGSGAVHIYDRSGSVWSITSFVKASNTGGSDYFGATVSLSNSGAVFIATAPYEDSNAAGVNGDQSNNSLSNSGAGYVYF